MAVMKLVPAEATEEMTLAAMAAKVAATISVDGPIPPAPKSLEGATYSEGFDRGMRWGAQTIGSVEIQPAVNAAIAAAPNRGKVSREKFKAAYEAASQYLSPLSMTTAVITALGLEIEE